MVLKKFGLSGAR